MGESDSRKGLSVKFFRVRDLLILLTIQPNAALHLAEGVLRNATIRADILRLEVANGHGHAGLVLVLGHLLHHLLERVRQDLTWDGGEVKWKLNLSQTAVCD